MQGLHQTAQGALYIVEKPRIFWTGAQWMAFTRHLTGLGGFFRVGLGDTPAAAYDDWRQC